MYARIWYARQMRALKNNKRTTRVICPSLRIYKTVSIFTKNSTITTTITIVGLWAIAE